METPVNNFSTTLAAGYTSGSGTCSLTSATGLSGAPNTYTLGVYDQSTGALTVLLRVTALSGTTATVTAEGTDASANSGDIVVAIMSAAALNNIGSMQLLKSLTASASASLNFTARADGTAIFQSDFDEYVIEVVNIIPATDAVSIILRMSTDGGSSYDSGANYKTVAYRFIDTAAGAGASATTSIGLDGGSGTDVLDNSANYGLCGTYRIYSPLSTAVYKRVLGISSFFNNASELEGATISGVYISTTAVNAFQVLASSGNLASGSILVYGLRKS